jgi:hypothetical protein
MEAFLNILWLVIAASALFVWRTRWMRTPRKAGRKPVQEWAAMVCALVLLFFAVSLTDDLHAEVMLSDDCFAGRRHCTSVGPCSHSGKTLSELPAVVPPDKRTTASFTAGETVVAAPVVAHLRHDLTPTSGRAPPSYVP